MTNTYSLAQVWDMNYEYTHYKAPVFRAFAEEKFSPGLKMGATFNREYASDLIVNDMGANGSYSTQGFTNSIDIGTVNKKKETSIQLIEWQQLQDHLPTQMKYTTKAANALWLQVDADVLAAGSNGAASIVDDAVMNPSTGTAGNPFTLGVQNVQSIFTNAIQQLQLLNVNYDPNKQLAKDVKLETISDALVCAISPQMYSTLLQYIGGKTTVLGDTISRNGHVGSFMGFNIFVSNNLLAGFTFSLTAGNAQAADTLTLLNGVSYGGVSQAITFTFRATPSSAGELVVGTGASDTIANLVAALSAPYTLIANTATTGYYPLVKASLTTTQQKVLANISAAVGTVNTTADIQVAGVGTFPVATVLAGGGSITKQIQHNLFGTSKSISCLFQKNPALFINPVSGQVARDLVTWNLYGIKVFKDQSAQLIDVKVNSANFGAAGTPVQLFN